MYGSRESSDLALAFNDMADALIRMRANQHAFVAGVGHDLRNPIQGMKMALHALENDGGPRARDRTLSALHRQLDGLTRMLDDLLDATRLDGGQLSLALQRVDLQEVAEAAVRFYQPTAPRHEIEFAGTGRPVWVHADPHRLEQIIGNLVSNAIKFSPEGGPIVVVADADAHDAILSVVDRGIGMSPADVEGLFVPFQRHRPEIAPGVGLGLSMVRRLVEAHAGRIDVRSEPGKGSTFNVRLPLRRCDAHAAVPH
jgi:signal transduction histidine kinase